MTKKIALWWAVMAAVSLAFMGCGSPPAEEVAAYDERNCFGAVDEEDPEESRDDGFVLASANTQVAISSGGYRAPAPAPRAPAPAPRPPAPAPRAPAPAAGKPAAPAPRAPAPVIKPVPAKPAPPAVKPSYADPRFRTPPPPSYPAPSYWVYPWPYYPLGIYPPNVDHHYYDTECRPEPDDDPSEVLR